MAGPPRWQGAFFMAAGIVSTSGYNGRSTHNFQQFRASLVATKSTCANYLSGIPLVRRSENQAPK